MNIQPPPSSGTNSRRRAAVVFIFVTVLLDVIAFGIIAPVLPKLIVGFLGGRTANASEIFGLFGTIFALMQFVCSPILGILSDRFGRRPIILASNFGSVFDYVVMALAPTLGWLFAGRVVSGITTAGFATAGAYIADVTPPEKRTGGFSMLWAAFGLGFVLGPALGGLLGAVNLRLPFWAAAAVGLANSLYGYFVLPESLPADRRSTSIAWRRANPVGSLKFLRAHKNLLGLASVGFLSFVAQQALPSIFVLYGMYRYDWSARTVGFALAIVGLSQLLVSGALVQRIVARIGDRRAVLAGLLLGATGFVIYAFASTDSVFWIGIPIMAFWGLATAAQSMMTHQVPPSAQGELQGALSSMRGIGMLVAPGIFTLTFAYFIDVRAGFNLPGAPWLVAALLLVTATVVAWQVTRSISREPSPSFAAAPVPLDT